MARPRTSEVLNALVDLLPHVGQRNDLGFSFNDREDALMDAILSVLEREHSLDRSSDIVKTQNDAITTDTARRYALRMIRNRLLDAYRRSRRNRAFLGELAERLVASNSDQDGPLDQARDTQAAAPTHLPARAMIASLSGRDSRLLLAYLSGEPAWTYEIEAQSLQRGAARVRIHRVLKRLRECSTATGSTEHSAPTDPTGTHRPEG